MFHSQSFPLGQPSRSSGNHTVSYHIMTIAFVQMSSSLRLTGLSTRTPEEFACSHECPQPPTFCFLPSGDAPAAPSHRLRGPHTARSLCGLPVLTPDTADPPRILTGQFWLPAACALLNPAPPLSSHPGGKLAGGHLAPDLWPVGSAEDSDGRVIGTS